MKATVLITLIGLVGCNQQSAAGCPAIEKLALKDVAADARAAIVRGDRHLLMLGGFAGEVPGVSNADAYPTELIEGTSDTTTEACSRQRAVAESYATKYNRTIAQTR